eukprot:symbB.v1.2.010741.t1/scaffold708.1/size170785/9
MQDITVNSARFLPARPPTLSGGLPGGATIESTQVATPEQGSTDDLFQHLEIEFQMVTLAAGLVLAGSILCCFRRWRKCCRCLQGLLMW